MLRTLLTTCHHHLTSHVERASSSHCSFGRLSPADLLPGLRLSLAEHLIDAFRIALVINLIRSDQRLLTARRVICAPAMVQQWDLLLLTVNDGKVFVSGR